MNFIFAGTPVFAARVLRELVDLRRTPALVISQPDRPRGRGRRAASPPAVGEAERLGLASIQVEDLNAEASLLAMEKAGAPLVVVAAFGQMLRGAVLERFLCLNVHASLLPAYRGATPIERALAAGEERTGVSIMRMTEGLDEGPWALQKSVGLSLRDDWGSVGHSLAVLGALALDQVLTGLDDGTVRWTEQQGAATYAPKLSVVDTALDPGLDARALHDRVRALSPHIGLRARTGDLELKIWRTWPYGCPGLEPVPAEAGAAAGRPGALLRAGRRLFLGCSGGVLELLLLQPAGKARMPAADLLRGYAARLDGLLTAAHHDEPDDGRR